MVKLVYQRGYRKNARAKLEVSFDLQRRAHVANGLVFPVGVQVAQICNLVTLDPRDAPHTSALK